MSSFAKKKIQLAYSPDSDDAFMIYALKEKFVSSDKCEFEFFVDDIQKLNEKALENAYDITAISVAAYPSLQENYFLMPIGASIGRDFGPAIILKPDSSIQSLADLEKKKIAVPGMQTSAFFAASTLFPEFTPVPMHFLEIEGAVLAGKVDAGIVIHELQLNCEERGFRKLGNLGSLWFERFGLPLPLGGIAIKRSLGLEAVLEITDLYKKSIVWGLGNREKVLELASQQAVAGLSGALADRYIDMYVNEDTLKLSDQVVESIKLLLSTASQKKLCSTVDFNQAMYS